MKESEIIKAALKEVNRDIEGMLRSGVKDEKARKVLEDARKYRGMLEEDLEHAFKKESEPKEPGIIGVIVIGI